MSSITETIEIEYDTPVIDKRKVNSRLENIVCRYDIFCDSIVHFVGIHNMVLQYIREEVFADVYFPILATKCAFVAVKLLKIIRLWLWRWQFMHAI